MAQSRIAFPCERHLNFATRAAVALNISTGQREGQIQTVYTTSL